MLPFRKKDFVMNMRAYPPLSLFGLAGLAIGLCALILPVSLALPSGWAGPGGIVTPLVFCGGVALAWLFIECLAEPTVVRLLVGGSLGAIAAIVLFSPAPAFADTVTDQASVTIPWGQWLSDLAPGILDLALAGLAAGFAWICRKLPSSVVSLLSTLQVEQLLARAVTYGINAVAGAEHDKVLSVKVGNEVLAEAITYAEDHAPAWLMSFIGTPEQLAAKLIARLKLSSDATVTSVTGGQVIVSDSSTTTAMPATATVVAATATAS
jgi:hypothetical protein